MLLSDAAAPRLASDGIWQHGEDVFEERGHSQARPVRTAACELESHLPGRTPLYLERPRQHERLLRPRDGYIEKTALLVDIIGLGARILLSPLAWDRFAADAQNINVFGRHSFRTPKRRYLKVCRLVGRERFVGCDLVPQTFGDPAEMLRGNLLRPALLLLREEHEGLLLE